MESSSSITKKIDEFIFGQVENFKNSSTYQQFIDQFSGLDNAAQKHINHFFAILVVLIPLLLIGFLEFKNYKLNSVLDTKREIYNSLGETSIKSKRLAVIERRILGPRKITSQSALQDILNQIIKSSGLSMDKIKLANVTTSNILTNLGRLDATIKFDSFSTANLTNFLRDLIKKEKMVIPKLTVMKNKTTDLLEGEILIYHHYRLN